MVRTLLGPQVMRRNDAAYDELCRGYEVALEKRRREDEIAQNATATPPPSPQPPASPVIGSPAEGMTNGSLAQLDREIKDLEQRLRQREKELLPIYHQVCCGAICVVIEPICQISSRSRLLVQKHSKPRWIPLVGAHHTFATLKAMVIYTQVSRHRSSCPWPLQKP